MPMSRHTVRRLWRSITSLMSLVVIDKSAGFTIHTTELCRLASLTSLMRPVVIDYVLGTSFRRPAGVADLMWPLVVDEILGSELCRPSRRSL